MKNGYTLLSLRISVLERFTSAVLKRENEHEARVEHKSAFSHTRGLCSSNRSPGEQCLIGCFKRRDVSCEKKQNGGDPFG